MTLGTLLREWRDGRSLRQAAREFGCTAPAYTAWEDDYAVPDIQWHPVIREKLEIDAETLERLLVAAQETKRLRRSGVPTRS